MSRAMRGGTTIKPGKIGRVNCIRQQILMPGERMDVQINGNVHVESLRERSVMRINAHLATFMTPVRWLWSDYADYVKEGPDTGRAPGIVTTDDGDLSKFGVGTYLPGFGGLGAKAMVDWYAKAYLRIYNEWYKWPEASDITGSDIHEHGYPAVPLSAAWNRGRQTATPDDSDDYTQAAVADFDVRDLAKVQARFRSAMKRDVTSFGRWMELIKDTWNGDGSREVDQVPIMMDQTELGVQPRDMPATDGASQGMYQSIYDFGVNHSIRGIVAPEHCVVTYMLVLRFPPLLEGHMPLAVRGNNNWYENVADPEFLSNEQPVQVQAQELLATSSTNFIGYLGAGWKWKCGHDVIGKAVYDRGSFPYMEQPTIFDETKDATRIKPAFRSQALGDYMCDLHFREESQQPIGTTMDSYFSGMLDDARNIGQTSDEFPKQGKML